MCVCVCSHHLFLLSLQCCSVPCDLSLSPTQLPGLVLDYVFGERERPCFGTRQLYFHILFSVIFNPLNVTSCAFELQIQAKTLSTLSSICMW